MSLAYVGPVAIGPYDHGNPTFEWSGEPSAHGIESASIGGLVTWKQALQLRELYRSPGRRFAVDGFDGVLVDIFFDSELFAGNSGAYLLTGVSESPAKQHTMSEATAPIAITAAFLGDRQPILTRSGRAKPTSFELEAKALLVAPWWAEDADGEDFVVPPGGMKFSRPYDPASPRSLVTATVDVRHLRIYSGVVTTTTDELRRVAIPARRSGPDHDGQSSPRWLSDRGGEVRVYDRTSGIEVGQGHPFRSTTDIRVENGLVSFWVGSRGMEPYLTVSAMYPDEWAEVGHLLLGGPGTLTAARLVDARPDSATVALTVRQAGEVFVTLKAGQRSINVAFDVRPPRGNPNRNVRWSGLPPTSRLVSAAGAAAHFGQGLNVPADGSTDLRLRWPANTARTAWTSAYWYKAQAGASAAGAGLLSIYDKVGAQAVAAYLDPADDKIKLKIGATTVASSAQTYTAGQVVGLVLRFSTAHGMALSVRSPAGVVEHVANLAAVDPGSTLDYLDFAYAVADGGTLGGSGGVLGGGVLLGGASLPASGVVDNHLIFDAWLSDDAVETVLDGATPLAGSPPVEGHLVWHAPYDARPVPLFSAKTLGITFEATTDGGTTRSPDANGLTKGLVFLEPGAGYGEVAAVLATTATHDDLADYQSHFAAEFEQAVAVR